MIEEASEGREAVIEIRIQSSTSATCLSTLVSFCALLMNPMHLRSSFGRSAFRIVCTMTQRGLLTKSPCISHFQAFNADLCRVHAPFALDSLCAHDHAPAQYPLEYSHELWYILRLARCYCWLTLSAGYDIPQLGFGFALIADGAPCLEAIKAGYRQFDSAQYYKNEAALGQAMRDCGIPREELFISACPACLSSS
jgi:hypothetical protein